ncbi:PTS ascorbate transporter subunit IIC [Helcococcus kunzii]|uniref:PTS ascorbate transporter subunit IIC n=1 Tax=Helcococcus kunzii TaxID=40091 RepID=UPI001BAFC340|nr:PTS ascorbate transporter subunit IIC [Helcococcus kunzii]MCT1795826.1 PTS ascorbate transporter subunit IIC [Helcococcus kunzii]MCT1989835.1 PTS ascorbate transporter subunit IIC [Helcococcus kunzii]QUY65063.1 PTS ascorbate transporter subunit IIC [Helcococcus kunzii]
MKVLLLFQEILSTPAILVGFMALLGLVLQKKSAPNVIKGTIKTIVGFLVLSAGASFLQTGSLIDFGVIFNYAFDLKGVVPNNEAIVTTALVDYAKDTAWIMMFGMLANIIIARFSRLKYIFLTGHHTLYMAAMIAIVLTVGGLSGWQLIMGGSLILGLVMAVFPALGQSTMKNITGTDDIALGHFSTVGYWLAAQVGKLTRGNKDRKDVKSTEDINFPKWMAFMRDTTVAISITMMIVFIVVCGVAASKGDYQTALKDTGMVNYTNWFVFALISGMNFAGAIYIILAGVRLILAEIVPAFQGIADKLVPNAKPAIDCPVVFPYAPNAVLIGFLTSFVGGLLGMFLLVMINPAFSNALPIILPGVVPHFFCGATAGVFANAEGGLKGTIIGGIIHGLLITILPVITMPVMGSLGFAATTFSDADFSTTGIILGNIARFIKGTPLLIICVILFLIPILFSGFGKKEVK